MNAKKIFLDSSLWSLLITNLVAIAFAVIEGWNLGAIMFVYWSQSVTIGVLWCIKINCLEKFSTQDFKINDRAVQPTTATKRKTAFFFLFHYGFFHAGYLAFIIGTAAKEWTGGFWLLAVCLVFAIQQVFSYFYNQKWKTAGTPNIGKMMMFPYLRILPMHLTIIFGGMLTDGSFQSQTPLIIFMLLKTIADLAMHIVERIGFADAGQSD